MLNKVIIKNFKSINEMDIELGRFNILIGENGCGKSNILEAICFGSAAVRSSAASGKLENEFLASRGIRVSEPQFMRAAFMKANINMDIELTFLVDNVEFPWKLHNDNKPYSKWEIRGLSPTKKLVNQITEFIIKGKKPSGVEFDEKEEELFKKFQSIIDNVKKLPDVNVGEIERIFNNSFVHGVFMGLLKSLMDFMIFSPEDTSLRTFEKEGQIEPLGIQGEGLFKLLKTFSKNRGNTKLKEIKNYLKLIDWFSDFQIPAKLFEGERYLQIKDRYLDTKLGFLDQGIANEGFLFLLFYFSLFISEETPQFFAIDNIDASLNPKLCHELIRTINKLSVKYKKQMILTAHNPSVLDGINLEDEQQRLFVIYRNKLGHTKLQRVFKPKLSAGEEPIKLSEAFTRGDLGGLPKNF